VEPPGAAALLDPAAGEGDEPESDPTDPMVVHAVVAPWSIVFITAASTAAFTTTSSATFIAAACLQPPSLSRPYPQPPSLS
jgi:hypothetical protein